MPGHQPLLSRCPYQRKSKLNVPEEEENTTPKGKKLKKDIELWCSRPMISLVEENLSASAITAKEWKKMHFVDRHNWP